jgi:aspartyl-tRNA synthetase
MAISLKDRVYALEVQQKKIGSKIVVAGWVADIKLLGKLAFLKLRDRSGYLQLVATEDFKKFKELSKLSLESVIIVTGKVKESKLKAGGKELQIDDFEVLSLASSPLPIDMSGRVPTDLSKRLDWRVLDLRNPKNLAIFKLRSAINHYIREFLINAGCIEMQTPKIVGAGAEGGATLFPVVYYGKKAYLSQSQQLYKQMLLAAGFDRVFEIAPTFRAEVSHTIRHLAEFTHFDFEMAWIESEDDVLKLLENCFVTVLKQLKEKNKQELDLLNVEINVPKLPFPRLAYNDAIKLLKSAGVNIKEGDDIGTNEEKKLGEIVKKEYKTDAYFIVKYPWSIKPFYIMKDSKGASRGFDFEYKGEELASGGQREHRYDILVQQIKEKGLNPNEFKFYLDAFKYGCPPHGGFGLGMDRLVKNVLNLENIREAVLFPRDTERLTP